MDSDNIVNSKGIESYLSFSKPLDKSIEKIKMGELLEKPVIVTDWEVRESRFTNNSNGMFVKIRGRFLDDDKRGWLTNTGSTVIIEQLMAVEKAKLNRGEPTRNFTCKFVRINKIFKMLPITEESE